MDPHRDILAQLAELKKWHEDHCAGDESDEQSEPKIMSAEDQAKIYNMLGFSPSFINEIETSQSLATPSAYRQLEEALNNSVSPREDTGPNTEAINRLKINNDLSSADPNQQVPKRPFLKRGQGLTNRFKIHPDRYKLQNLPKYKFSVANPSVKKRLSSEPLQPPAPQSHPEPNPQEATETPFKYSKERMRKSCLKTDSLVNLDDLRVQMRQLCTNAIKDDSEELDTISGTPAISKEHEEKVKRMLDFSRKSPKVTFHSEVVKIPFENYFHPEAIEYQGDNRDPDSSDDEEGQEEPDEQTGEDCQVTESIHCEFNVDSAFQKNAFISTPMDVFREKHQIPVDKSPRTMLVEKGSQLREKLKELEEETQNFREQNKQIQQMKRALDLEKVELSKQRMDMERAFKEQQLKMELYYEKQKDALDQERVKMEQRAMVPNKKSKEELKGLRDRIDELEKELKNREVKHGASQTRLRCHIRTVEKENREQAATIEAAKKENKRLEAENARLLRQKNNKMLSEINKNIAKLSTATTTEPGEKSENEPPVKAVAKKPLATVAKGKPEKRQSSYRTTVTSRKEEKTRKESSSSVSCSMDEDESDEDSVTESAKAPSSHYFPIAECYKRASRAGPVTATVNPEEKENKLVLTPLNDTTPGPKREIVNEDGSKDVYYPNGNLKKISADGMIVKVLYFNKDIKETNINEGTVKYYYAETKTWHTSYLDGLEILEFPSGQTEHRFKNGKIEIYFPNGLVRVTNPRDNEVLEEWRYPDGTIVLETKAKEKIIKMPNGQKEIHTDDHKRREYPDGTVKLVYSDGRTETRYSNGRIRIKDKDGQLISDSQNGT